MLFSQQLCAEEVRELKCAKQYSPSSLLVLGTAQMPFPHQDLEPWHQAGFTLQRCSPQAASCCQPWGTAPGAHRSSPSVFPCCGSKMVLLFLLVFWRKRHKEHPRCETGVTVASTFQKPHEDAPGLVKADWGLKLADMQHPESTIQKQTRSVSQKLSFCVAVWAHEAWTLTAVQRPPPRT